MIVLPMAGLSSRFTTAGYDVPKYMLPLHGQSVFAHAISSFAADFAQRPFLIIYRPVAGTRDFLLSEMARLDIRTFTLLELDAETRGQAETVSLAIGRAAVSADAPLSIFNIDTFRPGFRFPHLDADGWLEVFRGTGDNWSFARPEAPGSTRVVETAEKRAISDLCCTGFYHFARAGDFMRAYVAEAAEVKSELYVAPLYNRLIARGANIRYFEIKPSDVVFCGVPAEYEALVADGAPLHRVYQPS
jgi:hypothetical protein